MRNTDISKFTDDSPQDNIAVIEKSFPRRCLSAVWKVISTILLILLISMIVVGISIGIYLLQLANQPTGIDLHASKLNLTSFVYIKDDNNKWKEYDRLHSNENRIWVDLDQIPKAMKDAQVAIEDKRFYEHHGVDWTRTFGAVLSLASGSDSYGGSTLTQQLIKNITSDNEVSITRKLNEIFRALNLEREYTKDEILESYLNIVNYGGSCNGVESAANLYFAKHIKDCSIAQCAAIAGITQNPAAYDPLEHPDANRERRETVLSAMYDQKMISKDEYDEALKESEKMKFVGYNNNKLLDNKEKNEEKSDVPNWYMDAMMKDLKVDLAQALNISEDSASYKLYTEGLKIYCAMDLDMQNYAEQYVLGWDTPSDPNLETGIVMMGFDGRIIATVGGREKKTSTLVWDRTTDSVLQPGSAIKPVIPYPMAINKKLYNFSSYVKDEPIEKWQWDEENQSWKEGPNNNDHVYYHDILLPDAIERSLNAAAVQTMKLVGTENAYKQAINKLGFSNLSSEDAKILGALSMGGMNGGVTVRELIASYAYMGNGGRYYKPYTYYYVTDQNDNIIIDNRENQPTKAYSEETASIMNRLLHYNVTYATHTRASQAKVDG